MIFADLQEKLFEDLDEEERIEMFLEQYDSEKTYDGHYFFDWHGKLTGSCKQGREIFVKNNELDLDKEMTLGQFIELTKGEYGGNVILKLK